MPRNNEINMEDFVSLPNPGLASYFGRVVAGYSKDIRTPFAGKDKSALDILNEWVPYLEPLRNSWPTLWEYEIHLAEKVGPMSIMLPLKQRMQSIRDYYEDILLSSEPIDDGAVLAVINEWNRARGFQLRNQAATIDRMRLSTNSGLPYFTKRRVARSLTAPVQVTMGGGDTVFLSQNDGHDMWETAAILGWRGQEGGPEPHDVKQRVVWMFPFGVNICELQMYQPLIELGQRLNLVDPWISMDAVDRRITKLFDTKGHDDDVICTDFTGFDQHFGPDLQNAARTIISGIANKGYKESNWLRDVFPIKYRIPMMYNWGEIMTGLHGMGSGSGGTNVDETLVHRALQYEAARFQNQRLNVNSMCLGDDGIVSYPNIDVSALTYSYSRHGLEMNPEKQYVSKTDCQFLRRWHHTDYRLKGVMVGVYATTRALGRLLHQEREYDPEVWGKEAVALRQLSILENVKYHPMAAVFVDWCMKRDKYRLGVDIPGFLDNIEGVAKKYTDVMPDFLGYTRTQLGTGVRGISKWWIVNYLKSR